MLPAATAVFVLCLIRSEAVASCSRDYLLLCAQSVVPSLFVFSVLAAVICSRAGFYRVCRRIPFAGTEAAVLLMGLLGGFPLGAVISVQLYREKCVSKRQAEYLCSFTNNAGISFIVSYAGGVLGNAKTGAVLAVLTLFSSVLCGIIFKRLMLVPEERRIMPDLRVTAAKSLPLAIAESSRSMLTICGCIVFFGCLGSALAVSAGFSFPFAIGLLELSGGIAACTTVTQAAALIGFSGLSVLCQVAAVCGGALSVRPYLAAKIVQSAVMTALAYFLFDIN